MCRGIYMSESCLPCLPLLMYLGSDPLDSGGGADGVCPGECLILLAWRSWMMWRPS
jgi:hypothetical protein